MVETLMVGQLKTNCYLFYDQSSLDCIIIDPGDDADYIIRKINDLRLKPKAILATHAHFDHVLGVTELKLAFSLPFYMHQADLSILKRTTSTAKYFTGLQVDLPSMPNKYLKESQKLKVGKLSLKILETPGHTPGGVSFYCLAEKLVFVGDTIFAHAGYGRSDLEGGNDGQLQASIKKILGLPDKIIIYSGHGPATTVKNEKVHY